MKKVIKNFSFFLLIGFAGDASAQELKIENNGHRFQIIPSLGTVNRDGKVFETIAGGLSGNSEFVVGGSGEVGDIAFRWSEKSGTFPLGDLPGGEVQSWAEGISGNGDVVVGSSAYNLGKTQAVLWTKQGGLRPLGFLEGGSTSSASGVSTDGTYVVGKSQTYRNGSFIEEPFLWSEQDGMKSLGAINAAAEGEAFVVTSDGKTVGGQSGGIPFVWNQSTGFKGIELMTRQIPPQDGTAGMNVICAIADKVGLSAGGIITDRSFPKSEAFLWDRTNGSQPLGDLEGGAFSSIVYSISSDGKIAVGQATTDRGDEAFIWDSVNGMRNLQAVIEGSLGIHFDGTILRHAISISPEGNTIIGVAEINGVRQSWMYQAPQ